MIQKKKKIKRKILITGASGYVGATLVETLKDEYEVVGFGHGAEIDKDITDYTALSRAAKGAYAIIHTASPTKELWCNEHHYESLQTIVYGTRNVRRAAEEHKVTLVIHFSTQAVYSNFAKRPLPLREDMELQPDTFYGVLKALAEREISEPFSLPATSYKLQAIVIRPANIYGIGAGVLRRNVVSAFAENAKNGKSLVLSGDGKQKADFVHVRDIARLVALILKKHAPKKSVIINAGSGKATAIKEIARLVSAEMKQQGKKVTITSNTVAQDTLAADRWLSIAKAKKLYGWKAEITLTQSVRELLIHLIPNSPNKRSKANF